MVRNKKLKKNDINRNGAVEIRHSIDRIKAQERKYTVILVIFFMILFCAIGYATLTFNKNTIVSDLKGGKESAIGEEFTSFGELVTLTSDHVLSDEKGLKSKKYNISLKNNSSVAVKYQIVLDKDLFMVNNCGCTNSKIDGKFIRYSVEKAGAKSLSANGVIYEGELASGKDDSISVRLWLTEKTSLGENDHFHGHFIVKKV